ncbi:MAG: AAA family ATPase [Chloroflexota bacterium]
MYDHFQEARYENTYRQAAVDCVTTALATQRSVRVVGFSGMGKSTLLRYLVSNPQALAVCQAKGLEKVQFIYIDCNKLNPINPTSFYRDCNFILNIPPGDVHTDAYLLHRQFMKHLQQIEQGTLVVIVLDRAEYLYDHSDAAFFSQLRNLRDEARGGELAFILGSQKPLEDLYELEKLFSDTCWVGPMSTIDQQVCLNRHQQRLRYEASKAWPDVLKTLSGGHPGLLKNSLEWLSRREVAEVPPMSDLIEALLQHPPIQKYCQRLWDNLTRVEQLTLNDPAITTTEPAIHRQLQQAGLIINVGETWQLFSPLWRVYLEQMVWPSYESGPLKIELDSIHYRVTLSWRGKSSSVVISRPLVFTCIVVLAEKPGEIYSIDQLIQAIYPSDQPDAVSNNSITQLIKTARSELDPLVKTLCPAMTKSIIENVRKVGYRLVVDLPM